MDTNQLLETIGQAVMLNGDNAAIRIVATYEPIAGKGAKIFPPTYAPPKGSPKDAKSNHLSEQRYRDGVPVRVVLLDAVQSQANRCEEALLAEARSGGVPIPYLNLDLGANPPGWMVADIPSLRAPHRWADAYFRDAVYPDGAPFANSELWMSLRSASSSRARALFAHVPTDLVYGFWDSHQGRGTRLSRSYSSEMIGVNPQFGQRGAVRADPLNLPKQPVFIGDDKTEWQLTRTDKSPKQEDLSTIGHGMVPSSPKELGKNSSDPPQPIERGAALETIERVATISLVGLAALAFPGPGGERSQDADRSARVVLASLALLGDRLAFGGAGLVLRSGCELVLVTERLEFVAKGAATTAFDLDANGARALSERAIAAANSAGLDWASKPILLKPSSKLQTLIDKAGSLAEDVDGGG